MNPILAATDKKAKRDLEPARSPKSSGWLPEEPCQKSGNKALHYTRYNRYYSAHVYHGMIKLCIIYASLLV